MDHDDRALPLTRGQLDIWLAQETGHSGTVERDLLERAIRQVVREAEPARAAIFESDGQVFQRAIDFSDIEMGFHDLSDSRHPVQEAREIASSIQRTAIPSDGPLFKFALFKTWADEFYLFGCFHHIVVDGSGITLLAHRIATVYAAIVSDAPIPPAFFGSLQDLVRCESEYEASTDYLEDQAYWTRNLPPESEPRYRVASAAERDEESSAPVQLDPSAAAGIQMLSQALGVRRSSVTTAACALLVRAFDTESPEVVLDFPVSRRVAPEAQMVPGMISGFVPLVLQTSPGSVVAGFCR